MYYTQDYLTARGMASQERAWLEPRPSPREVECTYCATLLDKDDAHWDGIHGPYCDDCWEEMHWG